MLLGAACIYSVQEVELLVGLGGVKSYQTLSNSECLYMFLCSEGMGAKVHVREGKNPDHQLRSPNVCQVEQTRLNCFDSQDVGLEAAIHLKSAQQLTSRAVRHGQQSGINILPKLWTKVVGEHSMCVEGLL
eukprot:TRINITY_DN665_c0_g1_i8.p3 TRINITY_DN665_c0_g1~~TRINITY_DN665_c0_g1_i8.p3  ORF type:complete len:131 (-),score=5.83 TRINITY_DN665_c0_g1_i8:586-978(-)